MWLGTRDDGAAVAIKVAHASRSCEEAIRQEADLLTQLGAAVVPGVVELLDRFEWDGRTAFVMPRYAMTADGHVAGLIARWPGLAVEAVLGFAVEVARALHALHTAALGHAGTLVHRDVKPENILLDQNGQVRLADMGGTLVVDQTVAVRLAVFGTPLWAPYDQLLPGLPEPTPTWDTYALCVCLFWWLTGARPAYQADPSPMLTRRGREIWAALTDVARTHGDDAVAFQEAHRKLGFIRAGTREAELVEVRGHSAMQPEDGEAIAAGLARLADASVYGEDAISLCARDLERMLSRGLSPLSHPSPPNRFWDAGQLADEIDAVRARLVSAREAREIKADREVLSARVASMERLPATALPIRDSETTEEEAEGGIDPAPKEVRVPRAPRPPTVVSSGPSTGWIWGVLVGVLLFIAASIPLAMKLWKRAEVQAAISAAPPGRVAVSGAPFPAGDVWGDGAEDERPVRDLALAPFEIDRAEVSNADWQRCVSAGACPPAAWANPKKSKDFVGLMDGKQPAVGVTWSGAQAYCAWSHGRLPTEDEWEMAATWSETAKARTDKSRWPWGEAAPDCTRANLANCPVGTTQDVQVNTAGASRYGAINLVGNVWEWTSSKYPVVIDRVLRKDLTVVHYVLRGGAYNSDPSAARPGFRRHADPDEVSPVHGFRCAYDTK